MAHEPLGAELFGEAVAVAIPNATARMFPIAGVADRRHHRRTEEKYATDVDAGPKARAAERSFMKRCGNACQGAFRMHVTCGTGWTQDLLREQDHWRTVMGPSVLNVEQEKHLGQSVTAEYYWLEGQ